MLAIIQPSTKQVVTPTVLFVWVCGSSTTVTLDKPRTVVVPSGCSWDQIGPATYHVTSSLPGVKVQVDQVYIQFYFTVGRRWTCKYMHDGPEKV